MMIIPLWAKIGAPIALMIVALIGFKIWLGAHDRAVIKADRDAAKIEAMQRADNAADAATVNQMERKDAFEKSQGELANAADPAVYLKRLREQQDRKHSPATR